MGLIPHVFYCSFLYFFPLILLISLCSAHCILASSIYSQSPSTHSHLLLKYARTRARYRHIFVLSHPSIHEPEAITTPPETSWHIALKLLKKRQVKEAAKLCVNVFFSKERAENPLEYSAPGGIFDVEFATCLAHLRSGLENADSECIDFFVAEASLSGLQVLNDSVAATTTKISTTTTTTTLKTIPTTTPSSSSSSSSSSTTTTTTVTSQIVGFAELSMTTDHCFLLSDALGKFKETRPRVLALAVDAKFRRLGIGGKLVKACLKTAGSCSLMHTNRCI